MNIKGIPAFDLGAGVKTLWVFTLAESFGFLRLLLCNTAYKSILLVSPTASNHWLGILTSPTSANQHTGIFFLTSLTSA